MTKKNYYKKEVEFWRNWITLDGSSCDRIITFNSGRINKIIFNRYHDFKYEVLIFEPNNLVRYKLYDSNETNSNSPLYDVDSSFVKCLNKERLKTLSLSYVKGEVIKEYIKKKEESERKRNIFNMMFMNISNRYGITLERYICFYGYASKSVINDKKCNLIFDLMEGKEDCNECFKFSFLYGDTLNISLKHKYGNINKMLNGIYKQIDSGLSIIGVNS